MTRVAVGPVELPVTIGVAVSDGAAAPMSDAELRMVRHTLGLTGGDLAALLGVTDRTVRRWEAGTVPIPEGVRRDVEHLEGVASGHVTAVIDVLPTVGTSAGEVSLGIPRDGVHGGLPASWWRAVAGRVAAEVPGLVVRYPEHMTPGNEPNT